MFAEVCPHHLLFSESRYACQDPHRFLVCPPLRPAADVAALWAALADGTVDAVGSDHCQHRSQVQDDIVQAGETYRYGLAGIGARLPLLLAEGRARGLSMTRLADLAASRPGPRVRPLPAQGRDPARLGCGPDRVDPAGQTVLGADGLGDGTGDSVYAGRPVRRADHHRPARRAGHRGRRRAGRRAGRALPAGWRPAPLTCPARGPPGVRHGAGRGLPAALAFRCRARDRPIRYRCAGCATDCGGWLRRTVQNPPSGKENRPR